MGTSLCYFFTDYTTEKCVTDKSNNITCNEEFENDCGGLSITQLSDRWHNHGLSNKFDKTTPHVSK
jgi:hypothetical protein